VPAQDKQYLIGFAQLPDGATLDRTEDVIRRWATSSPSSRASSTRSQFPGLSINGFTNSSNSGIVFVALKPSTSARARQPERRRDRAATEPEVRRHPGRLHRDVPAAAGAGHRHDGGFKLELEDRGSVGYEALDAALKAFMAKAYQAPELAGMFSSFQVNVPQLYADIDRTKAQQLGVPVTDIFDTMQIYLGSRCTSTTSTSSAAPTPCACRPTRRSARAPRTSAC
jgi:multidrug efflux pump